MRGTDQAFGHEQWVLGFLSGIGRSGISNPLDNLDAEAVWAWIDKYCRDAPLRQVVDAAEALELEHPGRERR